MSEHYRQSTDPQTPNLRLCVERDGLIKIYEADMTSASETAQITDMHDKLLLLPVEARWLRDTLNTMDLDEVPETAPAPVPPPAAPEKRTCNRHEDCDEADRKARAAGRLSAEHCDDPCCEDCFGN